MNVSSHWSVAGREARVKRDAQAIERLPTKAIPKLEGGAVLSPARRAARVIGSMMFGYGERRAEDSAALPAPGRRSAAFTLIEIMVVIGIMAIIFSLALPSFFREAHKDSMRKAVADLTEACSQARARAVLNGISTEVRIRPGDRSINVVEGARTSSASGPSYVVEGDELVDRRASGGGSIFSAKLSDHILIEFIGVNLVPNLHEIPEVTALFYPNGTCDELVVLIRSDQGEIRKITTDVVTGIADVEVMK
jgi:prepilin-type N-terminal cleavage/methylation domain-containing protein